MPIAVLAVIAMGLIAMWALFYDKPEAVAQLPERHVAVLLPDRQDGAVKDNATLQWKGFQAAYGMHEAKQREISFTYPLPDKRKKPDEHAAARKNILRQMQLA